VLPKRIFWTGTVECFGLAAFIPHLCWQRMSPRFSALPRLAPAIADYELLRIIGRGAYGEVWLARNLTGSFVALKIVRRDAFDHDRPFEREFEGIKRFEPISRSDPSQVAILHVGHGESFFYYVMDLADDANVAADVRRLTSPKSAICNAQSAIESEPPHVGCYVPRTVKMTFARVVRCLSNVFRLPLLPRHWHRMKTTAPRCCHRTIFVVAAISDISH
jgi:hypothetical protein